MTVNRLRAIENGTEEATVSELVRLAKAVGLSPDYLIRFRKGGDPIPSKVA